MRGPVLAAIALLAALAGVGTALAQEPPGEETAYVFGSVLALLPDSAARVEEWESAGVEGRAVSGERLRAEARRWLEEALAPLYDPACAPVLARLSVTPPSGETLERWAAAWPGGRPLAAAPAADVVLVPDKAPAVDRQALDLLSSAGVLPVEVALSGEIARVAAARHAGPSLRPALLRHARAARLEGVARLAGALITVRGGGVSPEGLGVHLLRADRDRVSWPRDTLLEGVGSQVPRALLRAVVEDGMRWALFHYLRGGEQGVLAALERPLVGPEQLLRPGRPETALPADWPDGGCRLGPRGAAALVTGNDEPPWLEVLVAGTFVSTPDGGVEARLLFEDASASAAAAARVRSHADAGAARGPLVILTWSPGGSPAETGK